MSREIERKFLVESLPENLERYESNDIEQGYIAVEENGAEVRLRRKGNRYFLTVKSGGGMSRNEYETELSREQYDVLLPPASERTVRKTRYEIPHQAYIIELDVYKGKCEGLITAEIEFPDEVTGSGFTPPGWFGKEITEDTGYKNRNLALRGYDG